MGQAQPFQSEPSKPVDHIGSLRRLLADLQSGGAAIVKDGVDVTPTYILVLKAQIQHLETLVGD